MRQSLVAGERMFVDYAGTTLEVIDPSTGEVRTAQLFVAVLGGSNYTYAEATWTQGLRRWARRFGRASWRTRSKSSAAASGLPRMCVRPPTASIRRCGTCRRATGAMPIGRRRVSGRQAGRDRAQHLVQPSGSFDSAFGNEI
jgi:hypothetical protein